jgi:hypothetical protein
MRMEKLDVSGHLHAPATLPPRKETPATHWIGGWMDSTASLDDLENRKFLTPQGLELRPPYRQARG